MPRNEKTLAQLELVAAIEFNTKRDPKMYDCNITPRAIAAAVYDLAKIAGSLHKRYEAACSYEWACAPAYEARTERLEAKAEELGKSIGVVVTHQRDPRGWPLIVTVNGYETRLG